MDQIKLKEGEVKNNGFLHTLLKKKTGRAVAKLLDSADLVGLQLLFKCVMLLVSGHQNGFLKPEIKNKIVRKKKHILKTCKSNSLLTKTLKSKDLLRVFLKPIKHILPDIVSCFVENGESK